MARRKILEILEENPVKSASAVFLTVVLLLSASVLLTSTAEPDLNLKNEVELENIEDNNLGSAIIQRTGSYPKLIDIPEYRACIYSGENRSPVIIPVESNDRFLSTNQVEVLDLNVTVPEDELDRNYPNGKVNLTLEKKCPLRSEPRIVVTEISSES